MDDRECVAFLQWALPRLGLRWKGFRRVRRQVCRRIRARMAELGVGSAEGYRRRLGADPAEWLVLERLCRVTISRFRRDRGVFRALEEEVLPRLAARVRQRDGILRAWSAGCASGEEPYSLAIGWRHRLAPRFPGVRLQVVATDVDPHLLERARRAVYGASTLKELSEEDRRRAFRPVEPGAGDGDALELRPAYRRGVRFVLDDLRRTGLGGPFDLILCRNLAFTYFDHPGQVDVLEHLRRVLVEGGALVLGSHEELPRGAEGFERWRPGLPIHRRRR